MIDYKLGNTIDNKLAGSDKAEVTRSGEAETLGYMKFRSLFIVRTKRQIQHTAEINLKSKSF